MRSRMSPPGRTNGSVAWGSPGTTARTMSMREMIVPKSFDAQRTKAKTPPGAKLTMRRRRSRIFSSAIRPKRIQCSMRFPSQVSSTFVSVVAASFVDSLPAAVLTFIPCLHPCRGIRARAARAAYRRRRDAQRRRVWQCGRSSHDPLDLGGERGDFARGMAVVVDLADQPAAACGVGEADGLPDHRGEHGRVVVDEQLCCLAGEDRSRATAVENEAGGKLRAEDARFDNELQHLAGRPAVERRRLRRYQHKIGGKQSRTHQSGDAGRPIDDDVAGVSREIGRFPMQRVARKADDAEEPRQTLLGALLRPVERRSLRARVDQRDALALPSPGTREMQGQRGLADAALLLEQRHDHCALVELADPKVRAIRRGSRGGGGENEIREGSAQVAAADLAVRLDAKPSEDAPHSAVRVSERRSDLADPPHADSGASVRKNPKDSLLEKLRALQASE